jgi:ribosome maturation factor RimP
MKIDSLLEQTIPGLGYEFVGVEITPARLIRIYIDKEGSVTIDDCELVSNHLTKLFLVEEIDYNRLEVSSPGVERPLRKVEDFSRFQGKMAKVKTHEPINGEKVFQGTILNIVGQIVQLQLDTNEVIDIDYSNISRARLIFDYKDSLRRKTK